MSERLLPFKYARLPQRLLLIQFALFALAVASATLGPQTAIATSFIPVDAIKLASSFGPEGLSTLGDTVWLDINKDGRQQADEPGINGVLINHYLDDGDYIFDPGLDRFEGSMTTATNGTKQGSYTFNVDAGGNFYWVEIDASNFDLGGPLEGYYLTSDGTIGPNPLGVLLIGNIVDWKDADFGYATTEEPNPSIMLMKSLIGNADEDQSGSVTVGDTLTYQFVATNNGNVALTNVSINDPMAGLSTLSCAPAQPATLAPNETLICTATYVVTQTDENAGQIQNTALVTATPPGGGSIDDEDTEVVTVHTEPTFTPTPTNTPTNTPTSTPTPTPVDTSTPTPGTSPTATPTLVDTPTPTPGTSPTATPTPVDTPTPTPGTSPTATPTPVDTPTVTPTQAPGLGCVDGHKIDDQHVGLPGWEVRARLSGTNDAELIAITDGAGYFRFNNLEVGQWTFREIMQAGWEPVTLPEFDAPVPSGPECIYIRFKNRQAETPTPPPLQGCVEGYKVDDYGVGLPGWVIRARPYGANSPVLSTTTNGVGYFRFDDIDTGTWTFWEVMQSGWEAVTSPQFNESVPSGQECIQIRFENKQAHYTPSPNIYLPLIMVPGSTCEIGRLQVVVWGTFYSFSLQPTGVANIINPLPWQEATVFRIVNYEGPALWTQYKPYYTKQEGGNIFVYPGGHAGEDFRVFVTTSCGTIMVETSIDDPTPTPVPIQSPTNTPRPTSSPTPTATSTATHTPTPTSTTMPTATRTPLPTLTPTPTSTPNIVPIPGLNHPKGIAVNDRTNRVYVVSRNDAAVYVVDGGNHTVIDRINICAEPFGIDVNTATNTIYVACFVDGDVMVIDGATHEVMNSVHVGSEPTYVGVNETTNRIYVVLHGDKNVLRIDGGTNEVNGNAYVGGGAFGLAIDESFNRVYVTLRDEGVISIVDGNNMNVIDRVKPATQFEVVWGAGFNPVTNHLYVTYTKNGDLTRVGVYSAHANGITRIGTINIPDGGNDAPGRLGVNISTNHIFVPNTGDNSLTVIDGTSRSIIDTIPVMTLPYGIDVNPVTDQVYVGAKGTSQLRVVTDSY